MIFYICLLAMVGNAPLCLSMQNNEMKPKRSKTEPAEEKIEWKFCESTWEESRREETIELDLVKDFNVFNFFNEKEIEIPEKKQERKYSVETRPSIGESRSSIETRPSIGEKTPNKETREEMEIGALMKVLEINAAEIPQMEEKMKRFIAEKASSDGCDFFISNDSLELRANSLVSCIKNSLEAINGNHALLKENSLKKYDLKERNVIGEVHEKARKQDVCRFISSYFEELLKWLERHNDNKSVLFKTKKICNYASQHQYFAQLIREALINFRAVRNMPMKYFSDAAPTLLNETLYVYFPKPVSSPSFLDVVFVDFSNMFPYGSVAAIHNGRLKEENEMTLEAKNKGYREESPPYIAWGINNFTEYPAFYRGYRQCLEEIEEMMYSLSRN